jgi:hypothetical protein
MGESWEQYARSGESKRGARPEELRATLASIANAGADGPGPGRRLPEFYKRVASTQVKVVHTGTS